MLRPEAFQQPCRIAQNLPYLLAGEDASVDTFSVGGVLQQGHLVWTRELPPLRTHSILAFVDEVGVVSLDPRWLTRAESLSHGSHEAPHPATFSARPASSGA